MLQMPLRKLNQLTPQPTELDRFEVASTTDLRAWQFEQLKWSLRHAYENVTHYRAKFDAAGIRPDDLKSIDDLARFPFTTKADLRDNYPFGMFAVPEKDVARIHASSGTTGKPTVVGYTKRDLDTWSDVVARSIRAAGGRAGMKLHNAYGYGLFTGGLGAHAGAERLGCTVIPVSGGMTERQVQLINDFKPDIIMVTPSYMLAILDEFRKQGLDPRKSSLRIGIFGAEPWTNAMREEIEEAFDIHAVDIYGLSEVIGPGVASECVETKDGLHIWEDHFYPEIIDPFTGKVLPDGGEGELVYTSAARDRARYATDGKGHRPQRRHDHPAWRQRFSHPDRREAPDHPGVVHALPDRVDAIGPHGRNGDSRRGTSRIHRSRCAQGRCQSPGIGHQGHDRHHLPRHHLRRRQHRTIRRQGQAHPRSPTAGLASKESDSAWHDHAPIITTTNAERSSIARRSCSPNMATTAHR
jgi:phenylacetate-coenzyme A ligase PaaK-like adenylate-forming protein